MGGLIGKASYTNDGLLPKGRWVTSYQLELDLGVAPYQKLIKISNSPDAGIVFIQNEGHGTPILSFNTSPLSLTYNYKDGYVPAGGFSENTSFYKKVATNELYMFFKRDCKFTILYLDDRQIDKHAFELVELTEEYKKLATT